MGRIIRFNAHRHRELRDLLAWYATGQLSTDDRKRVDDHLAVCKECRDEVDFERRLEQEVSQLPLDVDQSWTRMREKVTAEKRVQVPRHAKNIMQALPAWSGWAAAAAVMILSIGVSIRPDINTAPYHVLGTRTLVGQNGNAVVIFRPEATEQTIRKALLANGARLVDGPSAAGGYILAIPPAGLDGALADLKARADVTLAEKIDIGDRR